MLKYIRFFAKGTTHMLKKYKKQAKEALFGLCTLGVLATLTGAALWTQKLENRTMKASKKTASVINHEVLTEEESVVSINLDMDGNTNTTEAVCTVYELSPLTETDIQNILPQGTSRSIWEWHKIGAVKMLSQQTK